MISKLFFALCVEFAVAALLLDCSIALVPNRPFDAFKVQRHPRKNVGLSNRHRLGSPTIPASGPFQRFAFSFMISALQPTEDQNEITNTTLSDNGNSSQALDSNFTDLRNLSSANRTTPNRPTTQKFGSKKNLPQNKPYFPFSFHQPQSTSKKKPPVVHFDKTSAGNKKKNNNSDNTSATALLNKESNETITVGDLEVLLAKIQSASEFSATLDSKQTASTKRSITNGTPSTKTGKLQSTTGTKSSSVESASSQVAFPQQSDVSETDIRRSTALTGCLLGMIIGITILPNLWLVGMIAGVFYGFEITKDIDEYNSADKNTVANFLISSATRIAKTYRKAVDAMKALWFLYKTGQLSYEYYKSYETLDKRFAIQEKVDAWNKVFVKGKQKFDAWEKENEVGRKVLAGLRTAWILDEESRKRASGRSPYRLVQAFYDLRRSVQRLFTKTIASIRRLLEDGGLETFWKGLKNDLRNEGSLSARVGAIAAAIVAVNVGGALFSLSAGFSNFLAIIGAVIWPSWTTDLLSRTQEIWLDIQSRGSNEEKTSGNIFECIRQWYEEYSGDRMRENQSSRGFSGRRRPKRKRTMVVSRQKKRKPSKGTQSKRFGFGKRQKHRNSGNIGTWGNFRITR